jgi:hypothetical protein
MARPRRWHATLDASLDEACLAVRLYNDPAEPRCFDAFTVHMHLPSLYYSMRASSGTALTFATRIHDEPEAVRIDGDPKRWELHRSVDEHSPASGPLAPTSTSLSN